MNGDLLVDDTDRQLLRYLREDARQPTAVLARRLGIARATVQARMRRLEDSGVITGYSVQISDAFERRRIRAHVMANVKSGAAVAVESALRNMPEVTGLYAISGVYDLIAIVSTDTTEAMNELLDRIGALDGVERTMSSIVLAAKVDR